MKRSRKPAEGGFTVLEVVVATFLFSFGVLATAQLITVSIAQGALAKQNSDAGALAAQTVEAYRDMNFNSIVAGTTATASTVGATTYTITTRVTVNDPQPNMKRIHVTVSWAGGTQSYVTETILAPLG